MFTRELQDRIEKLNNGGHVPPFPKGGTTSIYDVELHQLMLLLNGSQIKLLITLIVGCDEYNQNHRSREDISRAMGQENYQKSNMSSNLSRLIEVEAIAIVGSVVMVSPFLSLPRIKNPKLKAIIQLAWEELVLFV